MKKKQLLTSFVSLVVGLGMSSSSFAGLVEILPVSYTFDRATDVGSYSYHDETGDQLIDGEYGVAPWSANLGNGNAYEWLGWLHDSPVNIDFDFGSTTSVNQVDIGTVQDHPNDVVVPNASLFTSNDGITWSFIDSIITPESSSNNNQYFTLSFENLNLNSQYVRVSLTHSFNGPWTFTDEVDFYQATPTPTPATFIVLLMGLGFLANQSRRKV